MGCARVRATASRLSQGADKVLATCSYQGRDDTCTETESEWKRKVKSTVPRIAMRTSMRACVVTRTAGVCADGASGDHSSHTMQRRLAGVIIASQSTHEGACSVGIRVRIHQEESCDATRSRRMGRMAMRTVQMFWRASRDMSLVGVKLACCARARKLRPLCQGQISHPHRRDRKCSSTRSWVLIAEIVSARHEIVAAHRRDH